MKRKVVLSCAVLLLGAAASAHAGVILSPESVVANTMGEFGANFVDEHLIDQSGLSAGFVSGVTDFATLIS